MELEELKQRLDQEFNGFTFGKTHFPLLLHSGLKDAAIHSAGVSYLLALGIEFGLPAIAEYPVIVHADKIWKKTPKVMPDSIWFHPQSQQPWIAFEFERFESGDELKIEEKTKNLALSCYQSSQTIELCVLVYWLRSGIAPRAIDALVRIFEKGFSLNMEYISPPKCQLLLYKFIFCQTTTQIVDKSLINMDSHFANTVNRGNSGRLFLCGSTKVY